MHVSGSDRQPGLFGFGRPEVDESLTQRRIVEQVGARQAQLDDS